MRNCRFMVAAVFAVVGAVMLPVLPAAADTAGAIAFVNGKAIVQCPPDAAGNTGLAFPGLGVNKSKKCGFSFSAVNGHSQAACVGVGVSDPLKKGNKKGLPQAGLCTITASGTLGARFKSPAAFKIPGLPGGGNNPLCNVLGKPKNATGGCNVAKNQQIIGPWCGASKGEDGMGSITTGTKTISFDNLRFQSQGTLIVVTASGFKPGVNFGKPGQAGPVVAIVNAISDPFKLGGPASSCTSNNKNFNVSGIAAGLLLGAK